jgi:hypothetical protein
MPFEVMRLHLGSRRECLDPNRGAWPGERENENGFYGIWLHSVLP